MNKLPKNHEKSHVIPIIESGIFDEDQSNRFAIGIVALGDTISDGFESEFYGAAQLRSNVYLEQGFVAPSELDENGTELDYDDERSVHFAVFERTAVASLARVVANMRLIVKGDDTPPLPLERYYPDAFDAERVSPMSTEVSRLISRHEDPRIQNMLTWSMFIAGSQYVNENGLGPVYGLLTPTFTRSLNAQGVEVSVLAEKKYIPEIKATKQPVQINTEHLTHVIARTGNYGIDLRGDKLCYLDFETKATLADVGSEEAA